MAFALTAYALVWVGILLFAAHLHRGQRELAELARELRARLECGIVDATRAAQRDPAH
jgi:hypothetical protein